MKIWKYFREILGKEKSFFMKISKIKLESKCHALQGKDVKRLDIEKIKKKF